MNQKFSTVHFRIGTLKNADFADKKEKKSAFSAFISVPHGFCTVEKSESKRYANPLLPGTRAEMVLPLISRQETIGALNIQSTVEAAFTEQDLSVFEILSSLLATSIQNAFLFKKLDEELKMTKKELQTYILDGWERYRKGG